MKLNNTKNEKAMRDLVNTIIGSETKYLTSRIDYYQGEYDNIEAMLSKIRAYEPEYSDPRQESKAEYYKDAVLTLTTFRDAFMHLDIFA